MCHKCRRETEVIKMNSPLRSKSDLWLFTHKSCRLEFTVHGIVPHGLLLAQNKEHNVENITTVRNSNDGLSVLKIKEPQPGQRSNISSYLNKLVRSWIISMATVALYSIAETVLYSQCVLSQRSPTLKNFLVSILSSFTAQLPEHGEGSVQLMPPSFFNFYGHSNHI